MRETTLLSAITSVKRRDTAKSRDRIRGKTMLDERWLAILMTLE